MTNNENLVEVLNDLVEINNDRVNGYIKAAEDTDDADVDLKAIFVKMGEQSVGLKTTLMAEVVRLGGETEKDTSTLGKLHRMWIDLKATFTGNDREAILNSCEFGEDAIQKAYTEALSSSVEIDAETRQLIMAQQAELKTSHDVIKKYRDLQKA